MEKQDFTVVVEVELILTVLTRLQFFYFLFWINLLILFSINPWIVVFVVILKIVRNASQIAQSDTFTMFVLSNQ